MSKTTKGKTWEEIYGKEQAEIRRQNAIKAAKNRPSKKGLKWEDIYSSEECLQRRNMMKNNNPYYSLSAAQVKERNKKVSNSMIKYHENNDNAMQGRSHSERSKIKMSLTKKEKYKNENNLVNIRQACKERSDKHFEKNKIVFTCVECSKQYYVLPTYMGKNNRRKFCGTECQYEYYRKHPHINYKPNTWEQRIIDLNIPSVKFTGDFTFWITINFKNKVYHKNPDFIITKFSDRHTVIEILGGRFHNQIENEELAKAYTEKNVNFLFLTHKHFKLSNTELKNLIEGWINNAK